MNRELIEKYHATKCSTDTKERGVDGLADCIPSSR